MRVLNKKTGFYLLDLYCIQFFLVIDKNKCIHVAQGSVYLEKKHSCIVNPLREFAFHFVLLCRKGKENFQTKTGMVECFAVLVESGTIMYR